MDISVIIVTWNSAKDIGRCVESIFTDPYSDKVNIETIIIDNNSQDGTGSVLAEITRPNVRIFQNDANAGFTKGANQGIKNAQGKYILLLNPDTELQRDCIRILHNFLEREPGYAAAAPLLLNENGSVQYSIRNFPTYWSMYCEFFFLAYIFPYTRLCGHWKFKYFSYDRDTDVNQPMAAALLVRKEFLDKVCNLDERYFMFFNDVDLCKEIIDSGQKIRFISSAKAIHNKGTSVYKDRVRMIKIWDKDCAEYFRKHHNNLLLLAWLKISLKISEILRILYHKVTHK